MTNKLALVDVILVQRFPVAQAAASGDFIRRGKSELRQCTVLDNIQAEQRGVLCVKPTESATESIPPR